MTLATVKNTVPPSVAPRGSSPANRPSNGEFKGMSVRPGGQEALRRPLPQPKQGGTDTVGILKRSVTDSNAPSEGASTGGTRRLPPKGAEAARTDSLDRSGALNLRRTSEKGGELASNIREAEDLADDVFGMANANPTTAEDISALKTGYTDVASKAGKLEEKLRSSGNEHLADGVLKIRDEATARREELPQPGRGPFTRDALKDPSTVSNVLKAKSYTTGGAIAILKEYQGKADAKGNGDVFKAAIKFLEARKGALANSDDHTHLDLKGAQDTMGSKSTDKKGLKKADEAAKATIAGKLDDVKRDAIDPDSDNPLGALDLPLSTRGIREDGVMTLFLGRMFDLAGVEDGPKGTKGMERRLLAGRLDDINNGQDWNTITKGVRFQTAEAEVVVQSEIKPQSRLGNVFEDMHGGGINCHMAKAYDHVTNLAVSSVKIEGQDRPAFEGIRHGTLSAYKIKTSELRKMGDAELTKMMKDLKPGASDRDIAKDIGKIRSKKPFSGGGAVVKALRQEACKRRALDIVTSALVKDRGKLDEAIDKAKNSSGQNPVKICITSLSLLTPSAVSEKGMWRDQLKAWQDVGGLQPVTVHDEKSGEDITIQVEVTVLPFNFGVNQMALGGRDTSVGGPDIKGRLKAAFTGNDLTANWSGVDRTNGDSMKALLGSKKDRAKGEFGGIVGQWLKDHPDDANTRKLAEEAVKVFDADQSYKKSGSEPYQIQRLIGSLMYRTGNDVAWNCKSGKDRTGQLDVYFKHDAAREALGQGVGDLGRERTDLDRQNMYDMAIGGGNHEMQTLNTGAPGFKFGNYKQIADVYGPGSESKEFQTFEALSRFFGS